MISNVVNDEGAPVQIGPGRGDLRTGSLPFILNLPRSLALIDKQVSFARIFASQPIVAGTAGWLLRQAMRVPLRVYRRVDAESSVPLGPKDHPLAAAVEEPWERASRIDLVNALLGPLLVHGNGVADMESGAKEAIRFEWTDWRYALPIMPWRDQISGWELDKDDPMKTRVRGADTVLHVKTWNPLTVLGLSPLQQLGVTIAIDDAAQRHQRAMLSNGARPPSAIIAEAGFLGLKPEEREEMLQNLRQDVEEIYGGPENAGRPALLPPGLDWKPIGHTAVEAQLIEQRVVSRQEAITIYGLTPSALGIIQRGGELPEERQMAYTDGLAPPLILVEEAINSQLVNSLLKEPDVYVAFDFAGILRGDRLKEIEALREAISSALLTPNEGRDVLNMPRSDQKGMDEHWLPRNNLWPLGEPYQPNGGGAGESSPPGEGIAEEGGDSVAPPEQDESGAGARLHTTVGG